MAMGHLGTRDGADRPHVLTRDLEKPERGQRDGALRADDGERRAVGRVMERLALVPQTRALDAPGMDRRDPTEWTASEWSGTRSDAMRAVLRLVDRVAPTEAGVFVTGESGTGKELVAQTIHRLSKRSAGPFVAVNCGALAPTLIESELFGHEKGSFTGADRRRLGYFERANGGTLFLDEITEMPVDLQVKLLRVLETGEVTRVGATEATRIDVRVVAATNRDALEAIAAKALREDLFYRLNVFPIHLPPLRKRGAELAWLAQRFLDQLNARDGTAKRFAPCALERLEQSTWPGNVRELKNVVERAAILADETIRSADLPPLRTPDAIADDSTLDIKVGTPLAEVERRVVLATLAALGNRKKETAEALGISLKTLYNRLNTYQGHGQSERPPSLAD